MCVCVWGGGGVYQADSPYVWEGGDILVYVL